MASQEQDAGLVQYIFDSVFQFCHAGVLPHSSLDKFARLRGPFDAENAVVFFIKIVVIHEKLFEFVPKCRPRS